MTGPEPRVLSPRTEAIGKFVVRIVVSLGGAWGAFKLINYLVADAKPGGADHSVVHYVILGVLTLICICIAGGKQAIEVLDHLFPGISSLIRSRFPAAPPAA